MRCISPSCLIRSTFSGSSNFAIPYGIGNLSSPGNLRNLPEDISYVEKGPARLEEKDLWDMPFLFLLLAGLVSTEWILRKRKGLA